MNAIIHSKLINLELKITWVIDQTLLMGIVTYSPASYRDTRAHTCSFRRLLSETLLSQDNLSILHELTNFTRRVV
jgi:hypothetical protein